MKRNLTSFFLIISLMLFFDSSNTLINIHNFNSSEVVKNISYLSSDYFKGRLAGTYENLEVSAYIKNQFIREGLLPYNGDYLDPFETDYPHRLNESPFLKILDQNGTLIKQYRYGTDYREEMLNFRKNYVSFTKNDSLKQNEHSIQVTSGIDTFLFFIPQDNNISFRSSFMGTDARFQSMYIMVSKQTLYELKTYINKGLKVECFIPFDVRKTSLYNILGYIKGMDDKLPPVIISAHFDHLGSDLSGKVYNGALDNASGISFVLEFIQYIRSLGIPDRNIIFVAFNAEEFGCLGSEHFVDKYFKNIQGSKVFNFDMIGSSSVPLGIMGAKDDNEKSEFMRSITSTCDIENISYNYIFEDASDHEAFRKHNIDAVTFCDSDMARIHTPEDKLLYISTESIDRCFKVASREIIKEAFHDNLLKLHYKKIILYSFIGILIFSFIYVFQNRYK